MVTMLCRYPDGSTSEARYSMSLKDAVECYDPLFDYDARAWDEVTELDLHPLGEIAADIGGC